MYIYWNKYWGEKMKINKRVYLTFIITFIAVYAIAGFMSAIMVGIKWDESATFAARFIERAKIGLKLGYSYKIAFASICGVIAVFTKSSHVSKQST